MSTKFITLFSLIIVCLHMIPSQAMTLGSMGEASHPAGTELIDFMPHLQSTQSTNSYFGLTNHQDNFHADWQTITLLNDAALQQAGINLQVSPLDQIAERLLNEQSNPSIYDNPTQLDLANGIPLDNPVSLAHDVILELQDLGDTIKTPQDMHDNIVAPSQSEPFHSSSESAFDNQQAIELTTPKEATQANLCYNNSTPFSPVLTGRAVTNRLELLITTSNDPLALAAQIEVSIGKIRIYRKIFREEVQTEYRNFLWDGDGHFNPINTPERQEQALNILYPVIKNHFGQDKIGLVKFLERQVEIGTPGSHQLLNWETGKAGISSYAANISKNFSSTLASLNFLKSQSSIQQIENGKFIQHLSKLIALCKAEKFTQAKDLNEQLRRNISSASEANSIATVEEYNYLCALYENFYKAKCDQFGIRHELTSDPQYQKCLGPLQRGTMQPKEALKLLEAREHALINISHELGVHPKQLCKEDKLKIYSIIDEKTQTSVGRDILFEKKQPLLDKKDYDQLKEQLDFSHDQKETEQTNTEPQKELITEEEPIPSTEAIETIELTLEDIVEKANSLLPELNSKDPKEKQDDKKELQSTQLQKQGIKETTAYKRAAEAIERSAQRFERLGITQLSKKVLRHVINHHYKIGEVAKLRERTSIFKEDINLIDTILEALEFGIEIEPGVKTYDCGKTIGYSLNGDPTNIIAVFLNSSKTMITTVFPR